VLTDRAPFWLVTFPLSLYAGVATFADGTLAAAVLLPVTVQFYAARVVKHIGGVFAALSFVPRLTRRSAWPGGYIYDIPPTGP